MATTSRLALPYPVGTDTTDIPDAVEDLANGLDSIAGIFYQGTYANRSSVVSAPVTGTWYWATDALAMSYYDGTEWRENLNPASLATTKGDVLVASAAGVLARLGVGSNGEVLTVSGGVPTWAAATGVRLYTVSYAPSTLASYSSPSSSFAEVDGTNLKLSFTAGATGNALYRATGGRVTNIPLVGFFQDGSAIASSFGGATATAGPITIATAVSLSPGSSHTVALGWGESSVGGASLGVQGYSSSGASPNGAPMILEVLTW